jgi:uncharacterized protein
MEMRHSVPVVVLLLALVTQTSAAAAGSPSFPAAPPPGRVIIDDAGLMNGGDASEIVRLAEALVTEKRYPIRVVTIRSLAAQGAADYSVERYAAELMRSWGSDAHFRAYGMLLLVAAENRAARIQLGSAWGTSHDGRARRVMDGMILPAFRKGELSAGILAGVRGFDAMGRQLNLPVTDQPWWMPATLDINALELNLQLDEGWWVLPAFAAGGLVLLIGAVSFARRGRRSWAWAAAAFIFAILVSRFFGGSAEASQSGGGATGEW